MPLNDPRGHPWQQPSLDLSIVIVSWNTKELLEGCLKSLLGAGIRIADRDDSAENLQPLAEVILVDNSSSDGSAEMVSRQFPWVQLVRNATNLGFARANNQAIRRSRGRLTLLLNPDTLLHPEALSILVEFMDDHPQAGIAGSLMLNPDQSLQVSCYPEPTLLRECFRLSHLNIINDFATYDMSKWDPGKPRKVDCVMGACLISRRQVLDDLGLLDENYFIYSEELDLCCKVRRSGWDVYWVPDSTVTHYGGASTSQLSEEMFLLLHASKILFFRKQRGWMSAECYRGVLILASLLRLLGFPLACVLNSSRVKEYKMTAYQYFRLLISLPTMGREGARM